MTVWAQVSEADIVHVMPGQAVYFTDPRRLPALEQQRSGRCSRRRSSSTTSCSTTCCSTFRMRIVQLEIQMTAQVFIVLAQAKNVLLVPAAAVGNARRRRDDQGPGARSPMAASSFATITIGIKSEIIGGGHGRAQGEGTGGAPAACRRLRRHTRRKAP